MSVEAFLQRIKAGEKVSFRETIDTIEAHFDYTPVHFTNGLGDNPVVNPPGTNEGSCRIFSLGQRYRLTEEETLALFGELYWRDVLGNPSGEDHSNIRTFIEHGWAGIRFEKEALALKQK